MRTLLESKMASKETMAARRRKPWLAFGLLLALVAFLPFASLGDPGSTIPADRILQFLNQTIGFYRQAAIQQQIATEPQEQLLLYDNRQIADQIVHFAFDFARAQADAMSEDRSSAAQAAGTADSSQYGALKQMLAKLDKDIQVTQTESDADRQKLANATGARRTELQSTIAELQGEIALAQARRDAVRSMLNFVSGSAANNLGASGLKAQIEALAASVPAANSGAPASNQNRGASPPAPPAAAIAAPSGIWDLTADLFGLSSKLQTVNEMMDATNSLLQTGKDLRAPFIAQMKTLSSQGDTLAAQADTAKPAQLTQERQQLDALAAQFKQLSAAVIPLSKQSVMLGLYQKNLASWRDYVGGRYNSDLRSLGIRVGILVLIIVSIIVLSDLWRRAVYRYVHEARRRHQFLLIRKLVLWFVIALIVAATLAGRLSSFVTFAGLLTAGVAVALQNVILSVVGYFFLIGKFGIRVGDRVEVSGITGEVIDIGLVRFHLMEFGDGATPTGRVVAFSNSVVFQPTSGLFKQIPGASILWHSITLPVPAESDFGLVRKNLLEAVEGVLSDYRSEIERLYGELEKRGIMFSERGLRPRLEIHLASGGMEATIRYPVNLQHATDIDARVSRELRKALDASAKLETLDAGAERRKPDSSARAASR